MLTRFYMILDPYDRDVLLAEDVVREAIRAGMTISEGLRYIQRHIGKPSESKMRAPNVEAVHQLRAYEIALALNNLSGFCENDQSDAGHMPDRDCENFDITDIHYQRAVRISLGCNVDGKIRSPVPAWASLEQKRITHSYQFKDIAVDALLPMCPTARAACSQKRPNQFFRQ